MALMTNTDFYTSLLKNAADFGLVKTNKKIELFNIPVGYDIETSSFYIEDIKYATMYEWTFGYGIVKDGNLGTYVTYGRTWEEFERLLNFTAMLLELNPKNKRLVVYVHNLPYEWQWMRKRFKWDKVFLLDDRKPVYAITSTGIEFRCSLKLSGKSLANTAKDLTKYKVTKAVGDLDYNLIRLSKTPLTEKELGYCERDVLVMLSYIQEKIEADGDISRIPLTKTGYVRRYCKKACFREMEENVDAYEELEAETMGISRAERSLYGRLYARERTPRRDDSQEGSLLRFYQLISSLYGGVQIPNEFR